MLNEPEDPISYLSTEKGKCSKHGRHAPLRNQKEGKNFATSGSLHLKRTTYAFQSLSQHSCLNLSLTSLFSHVLKHNKKALINLHPL